MRGLLGSLKLRTLGVFGVTEIHPALANIVQSPGLIISATAMLLYVTLFTTASEIHSATHMFRHALAFVPCH